MKIKHLQCSLSILLEINEMIQLMVDKKVDVGDEQTPSSSSDGGEYKDCTSLLNLVRQRLQHILKSLIKLCLIKPPINKQCPKLTDMYKSCYQLSFELRDGIQYDELIKKLHNVLRLISVKVSAEMRNVLLDWRCFLFLSYFFFIFLFIFFLCIFYFYPSTFYTLQFTMI